jgi:O-antigen/teichoic acid export membrane protein
MQLLRGAGLRLASYGVGGLVSLAALPLLVRHLGVADFGRYVAVLSIVGIAVLASDVGVTGIALRESAVAGRERRDALVASLMGVRLAISLLGAATAVGFVVAAGYSDKAVLGTAIACVGLVPQIYTDMVVAMLVVDSRFGTAAAVELARSVAGTALVVVLVLADAGLVWFLAAWAAGAAAGACAARVAGGRSSPAMPRLPRGEVAALLSGSAGYALATVLHVVYFRTIMVVTSVRATSTQTGYFAAAFRVTEFVAAAAGQAAGTATPTLARAVEQRDELPRVVGRVVGAAALAGAAVAAVLALAAPLIARVIGGRELEPATGVLRIQALAMGLMFVAFASGAALFALRRHRELVVANAICLAVAAAAAVALVPGHGARGAALAAVIAEGVLVAVLGAALLRALRLGDRGEEEGGRSR